MRKIKEVLRLKWLSEHSERQIAKRCNIARSNVQECLKRAEHAELTWPTACNLDDTALEDLLYPTIKRLGIKARGRKVSGKNKSYELREPAVPYGVNFTPENDLLRLQNTYFWNDIT